MRLAGPRRALEVLQWFGVLGAALVWTMQHVVGFGVTEAECGAGGRGWGIGNDAWQIGLAAGAGTIILAAEAAAILVFRATRGNDYGSEPPFGRMRFFSIAAMVANVLFLCVVVLDGIASVYGYGCRQS